jgi:DNA-binding MarR family transcriptional regulator
MSADRANDWQYQSIGSPTFGSVIDVTDHRLLPAQLRGRTSFVVIRLANLLRQECADRLATIGLSMHQHAILLVLEEFGEAVQKDVAARLSLDGGDLVAFLDGLQEAGLITRDRDPRDRRRQILTITDAGRGVLERAEKRLDDPAGSVLEGLDATDRATLTRLASTVLAARAPEGWTP